MVSIWLEAFESFQLTSSNNPTKRHPLQRRMTNLQKAMIGVFDRLEDHQGYSLREKITGDKISVSFTTTFGELRAIRAIADTIRINDLPVSPLSFQHSVNNAAAGYFGMINKNFSGICVTGTGILSLDKALYRIGKKIQNSPDRDHLLIHCDEFLSPQETVLAQAYGFILTGHKNQRKNQIIRMDSVDYSVGEDLTHLADKKDCDFYPRGPFVTFAFPDTFKIYERISSGYGGECVKTRWTYIRNPD